MNVLHRTSAIPLISLATASWLMLSACVGPRTPDDYSDYPSQQLEWTIAFGPGGGNDVMARTLIDILSRHDLYPRAIIPRNRPAGAGAVGWGYVFNRVGNPYHITTTSGSFITTPMLVRTPWKPTDFTPIALLATDDVVLVVNGGSNIQSLEQFIERAKTNPPSIGGMGSIQVDFVVSRLLAREAGFDIRYVPFNSEGELTTALLSRSVDAVMANPRTVLGLLEAGELRALAFSGRATPPALGDLPTLWEAGYMTTSVSMPRGIVLPPGVPPAVQDWWIETIGRVVETPEWRNFLAANLLTEDVRYGEDFTTYLKESEHTFETVLTELGAIR